MNNTTNNAAAINSPFPVTPCMGGRIVTVSGATPVAVEIVDGDPENETRYYIGIGQPGFNSHKNNKRGYLSPLDAAMDSRRYAEKGRKARGE